MNVAVTSLSEVNLKPSRRLLMVLLSGLSAACAALWLADISLLYKTLILVLLSVKGLDYYRRYISLTHPKSILGVRLLEDRWMLRFQNGWVPAFPCGEAVVTSFLMCLRLRVKGQRWPVSLILFSDGADPRELHSLRIRLMLDSQVCLNPDNYPGSE